MHTLACYKLDRIGRSLAHLSSSSLVSTDEECTSVPWRTDSIPAGSTSHRLGYAASDAARISDNLVPPVGALNPSTEPVRAWASACPPAQ
jgi:hypothetical protein